MKKILKITAIALGALTIILACVVLYVKLALPNVGPAPDLKVEVTPQRVERGRYLATSVTVCMDCHSTRDWSKFSGPVVPGSFGKGGERFDQSLGFPGVYYSKNITPAAVGDYTDGELYRAITAGVNKHGQPIFPVMPYSSYGRMDNEDIYAIIAYLRTLPPAESQIASSHSDFPMNIILNTIPQKGTPQARPDTSDLVAYGGYLVNAAACIECHTPAEKGQLNTALAFAGGRDFSFPDGGILRSTNLTPDEETGLGRWTSDVFVQKFKHYATADNIETVEPGYFNTIMPWTMYATMTEKDLQAIYTYLRTLKPIENKVVKFTPAKKEAIVSAH